MATVKDTTLASSALTEQSEQPISKPNEDSNHNGLPPEKKKLHRPNYHQIHSKPLPLSVHPLPAFIPHNPISLFRLAYVFLHHVLFPPSSHIKPLYRGYFSSETRSVHITDPVTIRALWDQGFFGKGTLSRSEPTWLEAEKTRQGLLGMSTAEENTAKRRQERRKFKEDRARAQQEALEEVLRQESSSTSAEYVKESGGASSHFSGMVEVNGSVTKPHTHVPKPSVDGLDLQFPVYSHAHLPSSVAEDTEKTETPSLQIALEAPATEEPGLSKTLESDTTPSVNGLDSTQSVEITIADQEHLQLTLPEAFFLRYALGVLDLSIPGRPTPSTNELLSLCRQHSHFPAVPADKLTSDDPFLLNYAVYHHFRSLGWVIRPGLKFSVDYLLYNRGPVFAHAAYAVLIVPSYGDEYWKETEERREEVQEKTRGKDWHWLHCVNRVQSQVLKTLVLAYVEVPSPDYVSQCEDSGDVGALFKGYKIREVLIRRWIPNRNLK